MIQRGPYVNKVNVCTNVTSRASFSQQQQIWHPSTPILQQQFLLHSSDAARNCSPVVESSARPRDAHTGVMTIVGWGGSGWEWGGNKVGMRWEWGGIEEQRAAGLHTMLCRLAPVSKGSGGTLPPSSGVKRKPVSKVDFNEMSRASYP